MHARYIHSPHPSFPSLAMQLIPLPTASTGASSTISAWDAMDSSYPSSFDGILATFRETVTNVSSTTACIDPSTEQGSTDIVSSDVVPALLGPSKRANPTDAENLPLSSVPDVLPGWWFADTMRQDATARRRSWGTRQRNMYAWGKDFNHRHTRCILSLLLQLVVEQLSIAFPRGCSCQERNSYLCTKRRLGARGGGGACHENIYCNITISMRRKINAGISP